jgi:hypothetical protein
MYAATMRDERSEAEGRFSAAGWKPNGVNVVPRVSVFSGGIDETN